jgi:hypothetical protein
VAPPDDDDSDSESRPYVSPERWRGVIPTYYGDVNLDIGLATTVADGGSRALIQSPGYLNRLKGYGTYSAEEQNYFARRFMYAVYAGMRLSGELDDESFQAHVQNLGDIQMSGLIAQYEKMVQSDDEDDAAPEEPAPPKQWYPPDDNDEDDDDDDDDDVPPRRRLDFSSPEAGAAGGGGSPWSDIIPKPEDYDPADDDELDNRVVTPMPPKISATSLHPAIKSVLTDLGVQDYVPARDDRVISFIKDWASITGTPLASIGANLKRRFIEGLMAAITRIRSSLAEDKAHGNTYAAFQRAYIRAIPNLQLFLDRASPELQRRRGRV